MYLSIVENQRWSTRHVFVFLSIIVTSIVDSFIRRAASPVADMDDSPRLVRPLFTLPTKRVHPVDVSYWNSNRRRIIAVHSGRALSSRHDRVNIPRYGLPHAVRRCGARRLFDLGWLRESRLALGSARNLPYVSPREQSCFFDWRDGQRVPS